MWLKKEFLATNAKFVYSKDELGYQEVLDKFESAKEINIITYNISEKKQALIDALKKAGEHCSINIITNIPSRWETYYGQNFRDKASQKIKLYMTKLKPEDIGRKASVYFDFSNHGKIIMTDTMAYIGSANYSEESANNTEFGFIIEDSDCIEFIKAEVIEDIHKKAVPYYEYDYTELLLEANMALSAVYNIKNVLFEEVYRLHDDIDGEWFYYIENEACLTVSTLDKVVEIVGETCKVAGDIFDAIDVITDGDEDETILVNDKYEELLNLDSEIEDMRGRDPLIELSEFDTNDFINEQLQNEYSMEAYEENLQRYIDYASEDALCNVMDLTQAAKDDVDELLNALEKYINKFSEYVDNLRNRRYKKVSSNIDNT